MTSWTQNVREGQTVGSVLYEFDIVRMIVITLECFVRSDLLMEYVR